MCALLLTIQVCFYIIALFIFHAGLAQLVEHLPCKQRVGGSSPLTSSIQTLADFSDSVFDQFLLFGELLKWPTRADCKSADFVFRGSNPRLTTIVRTCLNVVYCRSICGNSSVG